MCEHPCAYPILRRAQPALQGLQVDGECATQQRLTFPFGAQASGFSQAERAVRFFCAV
jgi:hypothetical protein